MNDGFDREVLAHMITQCIHSSTNPTDEINYFQKLLNDLNKVIVEQVQVLEGLK